MDNETTAHIKRIKDLENLLHSLKKFRTNSKEIKIQIYAKIKKTEEEIRKIKDNLYIEKQRTKSTLDSAYADYRLCKQDVWIDDRGNYRRPACNAEYSEMQAAKSEYNEAKKRFTEIKNVWSDFKGILNTYKAQEKEFTNLLESHTPRATKQLNTIITHAREFTKMRVVNFSSKGTSSSSNSGSSKSNPAQNTPDNSEPSSTNEKNDLPLNLVRDEFMNRFSLGELNPTKNFSFEDNINPQDVFIEGFESNDEHFWNHHGHNKDSYLKLVERYEKAKDQIAQHGSLNHIPSDHPYKIAYDAFNGNDKIVLDKYKGKYILSTDGRHRVAAAQILKERGHNVSISAKIRKWN